MRLIRASGENLTLLIAKGNDAIAAKVSSTSCWCSDINVIYVLYMFVMDFAGLPRWYLQYFIWHIQVYLVLPVIGYLLLCKNPNTSLLKLVGIYQRRWLKRSEKILKRNNIIYTEIRFHRNLVKMHGIVQLFYKRMKAIVIKL